MTSDRTGADLDEPLTYPKGHAMNTDDHNADRDLVVRLDQAASGIAPDPHFADRLWAELDRRSGSNPEAVPTWARPAGNEALLAPVTGPVFASHPGRRRRSAPRWASPLTTIAAALVIAVIGFGALSLSGADPGDLLRQDVPKASAQGTAGEGDAVVGTWVIWDDSFGSSTILALMTFYPNGSLAIQYTLAKTPIAFGSWSEESNGTIRFASNGLFSSESIEDRWLESTEAGLPIPVLVQLSGSMQLGDDGRFLSGEWTREGEFILVNQDGDVYRYPDEVTTSDDSVVGSSYAERLEDVIARATDLSPEQMDALQALGSSNSSSTPPATTALPTQTVRDSNLDSVAATPSVTPSPGDDADPSSTTASSSPTATVISGG